MTEPAKPERPQPQPGDYPHRITDNTRYGDVDAQGHVNNKVILGFFESGRVMMFREPDLGVGIDGAAVVLVQMDATFVRELHWPGTVEIGTAVVQWGRTSFTLSQAVFRDDACIAFGRATLVLIDQSTRRPRPLTDAFKAKLEAWKLAARAQEA